MATIRPATEADAPRLAELFREVLRDGRGMVMEVEDAPDADAVARRIAQRDVFLVVEQDGAIIGEGTISPFGPRWIRHVGLLAMHLHPSVQGRGLGRLLLRALLEAGRAAGLLRVELYVRADNERALALYRSEGFVGEGVRRAFVRPSAGRAVDDVWMARFFHAPRNEKAVALVVRQDRGAPELLALGHPTAGIQVPRGTLEAGEDPAEAVLRELEEESGLVRVRIAHALPPWDQPMPHTEADGLPVLHRTHAFVLAPDGELPETWTWHARGSSEEDGLLFSFSWQPVANASLHPVFDEALARLRAYLRIAPAWGAQAQADTGSGISAPSRDTT